MTGQKNPFLMILQQEGGGEADPQAVEECLRSFEG
jgi:hypothetical protein